MAAKIISMQVYREKKQAYSTFYWIMVPGVNGTCPIFTSAESIWKLAEQNHRIIVLSETESYSMFLG